MFYEEHNYTNKIAHNITIVYNTAAQFGIYALVLFSQHSRFEQEFNQNRESNSWHHYALPLTNT